jgi:hypothetical protein
MRNTNTDGEVPAFRLLTYSYGALCVHLCQREVEASTSSFLIPRSILLSNEHSNIEGQHSVND